MPLCLTLPVLAACRQGAQGFGTTAPGARQHADDFLGAIATRFTDVHRTPKFALARPRIARHALTPSKLVNDTALWTSREPDGTRVLNVAAYSNGSRYIFHAARDWPLPKRPGQSRHHIRLRPLGESEYEWSTAVDQAIGGMPADGLSSVFSGMFLALEQLPEVVLRTDARLQFPRTASAFGRLFSLDTIRSVANPAGGRNVMVVVRLHPDRLEKTFPAFAAYLKKYVAPSRYRFTLRDRGGMRWMEADADDNRLMVRFRVQGGDLQPFDGPARRMPDVMRLHGELMAKVMVFEVGATELRADARRIRTAREDGWRLTFEEEPEWKLPLATRHLIKAPLRRPFEQGGMVAVVSIREDGGATYLSRGFRMVVKESAILRWLGSLGWTAMSDFAGAGEAEENRFIAEGFTAMRLDTRDILRAEPVLGQ